MNFQSFVSAVAVTPSDTAGVSKTTALWIGGAGNVSVIMAGAQQATPAVLTAVPAGTLLPLAVVKVRATGTTATNIIALR